MEVEGVEAWEVQFGGGIEFGEWKRKYEATYWLKDTLSRKRGWEKGRENNDKWMRMMIGVWCRVGLFVYECLPFAYYDCGGIKWKE